MFNKLMKWVLNNIRKPLALVVLGIAMLIGATVATYVNRFSEEQAIVENRKKAEEQRKKELLDKKKGTRGKDAKREAEKKDIGREKLKFERSVTGTTIAFTILAIAFVIVAIASRGSSARDTLSQPFYIALIAIPALCVLLYLFFYTAWAWYWDHQLLFWGVAICAPLIAYFMTRPQKGFRSIGWGMIVLVGIGLISYLFPDMPQIINPKKPTDSLHYKASVDEVLCIIGEAESPGEPGGKQLDDKGEPVVNVNTDGSKDWGALQINDKHNADLIADNPELDYKHSKADNYALGRLIVERDGGYQAWNASKDRWAPKLAALGYGRIPTLPSNQYRTVLQPYTKTVEAPISDWSEPIIAEPGYNFTTGWVGEGRPKYKVEYTTRDGRIFEKEFPAPDGKKSPIQGDIGKFRAMSLEDEKVIFKVAFSPI